MKKVLIALMMVLAIAFGSGVASAKECDNDVEDCVAEVVEAVSCEDGGTCVYMGFGLGFLWDGDTDVVVDTGQFSAQFGWQITDAYAVELEGRHSMQADLKEGSGDMSANFLGASLIRRYSTNIGLMPYALIGLDYGWFDVSGADGSNEGTLAKYGAGLDYEVTETFSFGVRYVYTNDICTNDFSYSDHTLRAMVKLTL